MYFWHHLYYIKGFLHVRLLKVVCYCFLTGMKTGAQTMLRFNACASLEPTCAGGYRTANAISTNSYIRSARVVSRLILFLCLCFFVCTLFGYFFVTGANFGECFVLFYCLFLVTIKILTFSKDIKILLILAWLWIWLIPEILGINEAQKHCCYLKLFLLPSN